MRRALRPRFRIFRSLLTLALLAWATFALDVFARPLTMLPVGGAQAATMMSETAGTPCHGMQMDHASRSPHPAGHGCCQHGHCYCAPACNGIVGVPRLALAFAPTHPPVRVPVHAAPALTPHTPPLRPPIG